MDCYLAQLRPLANRGSEATGAAAGLQSSVFAGDSSTTSFPIEQLAGPAPAGGRLSARQEAQEGRHAEEPSNLRNYFTTRRAPPD